MRSIEMAAKIKEKLSAEYGVSTTAIVWVGNGKFVVCKDGEEHKIIVLASR